MRLDVSEWLGIAAAGGALLLFGCRQDMHNAPRYKPLAESTFFADGSAARPLPAGTVARGKLHEDPWLYQGRTPDGAIATSGPLPLTRELLLRGRERFNIFCAPCHDQVGTGRGMVVQRGFKAPSSFHDPRLRMSPDGYFFYVITNGFGVMPSYAAQVPAEDRWAIIAWIRTLQRAQHFPVSELTAEERQQLEAASSAPLPGS